MTTILLALTMLLQPDDRPRVYASAQSIPAPAVVVVAGDPYGFGAWVNGIRAARGLRPLAYDPNLAAWCAENNRHQRSRGMGHHVMGACRRQNAGWGGFAAVCRSWLTSPAHYSALVDPSATAYGIAADGPYWTYGAR